MSPQSNFNFNNLNHIYYIKVDKMDNKHTNSFR